MHQEPFSDSGPDGEEPDGPAPLSEKLVAELTAYRHGWYATAAAGIAAAVAAVWLRRPAAERAAAHA